MSKMSNGKSGSASDGKLPKSATSPVSGGNKLQGQKAASTRGTKSY